MSKWLIASDIHGSALYCSRLLEHIRREAPERVLLLGDLLYHGPRNDLPEGYDPKQVITMLNSIRDLLLCVRGNCEAEVDQMVLKFPVLAEYAVVEKEGQTVFATHGHHYNEQNPPPHRRGDILLCGHTHVPGCTVHEDFIYMNPGSVSIPKGGSPRSFLLWEAGVFTWRELDTGKPFLTSSGRL